MKSHTTSRFRKAFQKLPGPIQHRAREAFTLFEQNPQHPSLRFKKIHPSKPIYSVRISLSHRALGVRVNEEMIWFWIGSHDDYERVISQEL